MEDTEIAHLAGVFDAIGTATVHITKNDRYTIGYQFQAILRLIRPKDDSDPLMGKLMAYCDENGVRYSISEKSHGANQDTESYEWVCKNPESIRRFLEPMVPYFVTNYEGAVLMLEQVIPRMEDNQHQEKGGFYELMGIADQLRRSNRRGPDVKYDQDYFAEKWSLSE